MRSSAVVLSVFSFGLLTAALSAVGCNDGAAPPPNDPSSVGAGAGAVAPITTVVVDAGGTSAVATAVAAGDPPPAPVTPAAPATPTATTTTADGGADFYSCGGDSDCAAVPQVNCCPNGRLEAVNKQSVDAYRSSLVCEKKHRICPQYRVMDHRTAVCGTQSHKCELIQPGTPKP